MPVITDHPLRLRRIRAGLSQAQLGKLAGMTRAAVAQIEEGRTKAPKSALFIALSRATNVSAAVIVEEFNEWQRQGIRPVLTESARRALALSPERVAMFASFEAWRSTIAPNPTAFASLLHLPRTTVVGYEADRSHQMPTSVYRALTVTLGLSPAYVHELELLHDR